MRSWQSTLLGILTLGLAGFSIYRNPSIATNPQTAEMLATGIQLLKAPDDALVQVQHPAPAPPAEISEPEKPASQPPEEK